jgi:hypothetical protein
VNIFLEPSSQQDPTSIYKYCTSAAPKMPEKINVLFVCLGNICRSTMAEGILRSLAKEEPYKSRIGTIDSCGTCRPTLPLSDSQPGAPHRCICL